MGETQHSYPSSSTKRKKKLKRQKHLPQNQQSPTLTQLKFENHNASNKKNLHKKEGKKKKQPQSYIERNKMKREISKTTAAFHRSTSKKTQ